jgi:LPS export ABC transporter protein LptC
MIKFNMKKFLMIGLCIFFASILFIMFRNERESSEIIKIHKSNSFIEGFKILHEKNGNTVWTLTAKRADFTGDENMAELSDINVVVQKNGMTLHADKGIYNLPTQNITINSEITAETKDYKITTTSIDYEASSGELKTDKKITVEGKKFKVEGKGMTLDSQQKVRVQKDVKATFYK